MPLSRISNNMPKASSSSVSKGPVLCRKSAGPAGPTLKLRRRPSTGPARKSSEPERHAGPRKLEERTEYWTKPALGRPSFRNYYTHNETLTNRPASTLAAGLSGNSHCQQLNKWISHNDTDNLHRSRLYAKCEAEINTTAVSDGKYNSVSSPKPAWRY